MWYVMLYITLNISSLKTLRLIQYTTSSHKIYFAKSASGGNVPGTPGARAMRNLRIWYEAHVSATHTYENRARMPHLQTSCSDLTKYRVPGSSSVMSTRVKYFNFATGIILYNSSIALRSLNYKKQDTTKICMGDNRTLWYSCLAESSLILGRYPDTNIQVWFSKQCNRPQDVEIFRRPFYNTAADHQNIRVILITTSNFVALMTSGPFY